MISTFIIILYYQFMFDWFDDAGELEEDEYLSEKVPFNLPLNNIYLLFKIFLWNLMILDIILLFIVKTMDLNYIIFNIYSFKGILLNIFLFGILFFLISIIIRLIFYLIEKIKFFYIIKIIEIIGTSGRWISTTIWLLIIKKQLLNYKEINEIEKYFKLFSKIINCSFITSITCFLLSTYLCIFFNKFIHNRVKDKIKEVEKSEKVLNILKKYQFSIIRNQEIEEEEKVDFICLFFKLILFFNKSIFDNIGTDYNIKNPEIKSVKEAQLLAKRVFEKTTNKNYLSFKDFSKIFENNNLALLYFNRFDFDNNKTIEREEFRNTIIQFYLERINLERSINVSKKFINMINCLITILYIILLIFAYLIIWGIQLKKLLAVSFSSAILINFSISKMAKHFYKSLLILLNHPYDIGDQICIKKKLYIVREIGFSTTSLIAENGSFIKFLNSDMWKKNLFNFTKSPEQLLIFNFSLHPKTDIIIFSGLKKLISNFLKQRSYDYNLSFSLRNQFKQFCSIKKIDCELILKIKKYKTNSKKLYMRTEFTKYLLEAFEELNIKIIN